MPCVKTHATVFLFAPNSRVRGDDKCANYRSEQRNTSRITSALNHSRNAQLRDARALTGVIRGPMSSILSQANKRPSRFRPAFGAPDYYDETRRCRRIHEGVGLPQAEQAQLDPLAGRCGA